MKIDMMESLGYSFLRHVRGCWIVQTNWKWPSAAWDSLSDELQAERQNDFEGMKTHFGENVFKKTKNVEQLLKQAELDALGVTRNGDIHAVEVAFHAQGLTYGQSPEGTTHIVRKKMLRTLLVLRSLDYSQRSSKRIWFLSPKVRRGRADKLNELFGELKRRYDDVDWSLSINEKFANEVWDPTRSKTNKTSDTSELLLRANRLLETVKRAGGTADE